MPEWCTGIPVLVHWAAIAMFCMAARGFALRACDQTMPWAVLAFYSEYWLKPISSLGLCALSSGHLMMSLGSY